LVREPRFTAAVLVPLALCLGANLTVFAVVDSILLRPLPFPEPGRLVAVFNTYPQAGVLRDGSSITNYYERRGKIGAFSGLALFRQGTAIVGEAGSTQREEITRVSPEFFSTLGAGPILGRAFTEAETSPRADGVTILTDAYWRQRFNADPQVLGRAIRVNGLQKKVIGVLAPDFRFLSSEARLYFPLSSESAQRAPKERHSGIGTEMIARLRPGIPLAEAQAQIDAHNAVMERDDPEAKMMADAGFRSLVVPLHADHVGAIRPTLLLLQAGVLFLLLIGGVNLVNLLLVRASGRTRELAIKQSMGASRWQVVSEVMVETVLLTLVGGGFGLAVGAGGIRFLAVLGADRLPLGAHIAFDARVAGITLLGALGMGTAIALPIAWFNLRGQLAGTMQSESRGSTAGRAAQRLRHSFIVAQIALAFVLLAGAGLLAQSLERAMAVSPGFRPDHTLTGQITLPGKNYPDDSARVAFTDRLLEAIGHQPGVSAVGVLTNVPFSGVNNKTGITVKGHVLQPGESIHGHYAYGVAGDTFAAFGIPLREGRFLTAADSHRQERVCVVDEDFARRYWPRGGAIGQRLFRGGEASEAETSTIVGVVGAVKQADLAEAGAQGAVYFPYNRLADSHVFVVTRMSLAAESFGATLRKIVREIDRELPVDDLRPMEVRISDSLVARRSPALLTGIFAGVALLLAAIGTYGVLSYAVARRRREIGLRMALGALPGQIRGQFLSLGLRLLAAGTLLGVLGAWMAGRAMRGILFGVPTLHVATLVGTTVILSGVSLFACLLPSDRAARISPMEALSEE
jgi:predicted permease